MSENPIDYLKQIDIIDKWGSVLVDVILQGLSLDAINNLMVAAQDKFILFRAAAGRYFFFLLKKAYTPEQRDIIISSTLILSTGQFEFNHSWSTLQPLIRTFEAEYTNAVNNVKSNLPFIYIFAFSPNKEEFKTPDETYIEVETSVFGGSIVVLLLNAIAKTNKQLNLYRGDLNRHWKLTRYNNMEDRLFRKLQLPARTNCYIRPTPPAEIQQILDQPAIDVNTAKNRYLDAIENEDGFFSGFFTPYPIQFALVELPEQPIRPTPEELQQEAQINNPILPDREFSEKEDYCFRRWTKIQELFDERQELSRLWEENKCDSGGDFFFCQWLGQSFNDNDKNSDFMVNVVRYPEEWEDKLIKTPLFVPPTQQEIDKHEIDAHPNCREMPDNETWAKCRLDLANKIELYNINYGPSGAKASKKETHRKIIVAGDLSWIRRNVSEVLNQPLTPVTISFEERDFRVELYGRIYGVNYDIAPLVFDSTLFAHADPILLVKEQEYEKEMNLFMRQEEIDKINIAAGPCGEACEILRGWIEEANRQGMSSFFRARISEAQAEVNIQCAEYRTLRAAYIEKYGEAPPVTSRFPPC